MAVRYRPQDGIVGDIIPFYDVKTKLYHVFYLKADGVDSRWPRWQTTWGHIASANLVVWEELPDALERGLRSEPDGGACSTGSVIEKDGVYHIFYFGLNPGKSRGEGQLLGSPGHPGGREQMMHATSKDCVKFEKDRDFSGIPPDTEFYLFGDDWRDPRVFWCETDKCYYVTITANSKNSICSPRKGVIGLAKSLDLKRWTVLEPIYQPNIAPSLECSDVFTIHGRWYLVFSQFGGYTEYRFARSMHGPWMRPANPVLDGGASFFYAARTLFDGKRRLLFGWCGTLYENKDGDFGQWGGDLVCPRELVVAEDGQLGVKCPDEIEGCGARPEHKLDGILGSWRAADGDVECQKQEGFCAALFNCPSVECMVRTRIKTGERSGKGGVLVNCADDTSECYCTSIDFGTGAVEVIRYKVGGKKNDFLPELYKCLGRQFLPTSTRDRLESGVDLLVIVKGGIIEVFVDGRISITVRVQDIKGRRVGLFSEDAAVGFQNPVLFSLGGARS